MMLCTIVVEAIRVPTHFVTLQRGDVPPAFPLPLAELFEEVATGTA